MNQINEQIICAGFGGQGIMVLGKALANAGLERDLFVTWLPSYGAEVRGGTAHSIVKISSEPIASPKVQKIDTAIIMNGPSLDKFEDRIVPGGLLILNSSIAACSAKRSDIEVVEAPLTEEAIKLGNTRVANMIAAGIYAVKKNIIDESNLRAVIEKMAGGKQELIPVNIKALERGIEIATNGK